MVDQMCSRSVHGVGWNAIGGWFVPDAWVVKTLLVRNAMARGGTDADGAAVEAVVIAVIGVRLNAANAKVKENFHALSAMGIRFLTKESRSRRRRTIKKLNQHSVIS
jgi:hypothetical protein